jgi:SAM-dependent methyltransferase
LSPSAGVVRARIGAILEERLARGPLRGTCASGLTRRRCQTSGRIAASASSTPDAARICSRWNLPNVIQDGSCSASTSAMTCLAGGRARADRRGLTNVRIQHADLTRPVCEGGFDVVLAIECLVEIPEDEAALRVMTRALTPGGMLLTHVPERPWRGDPPWQPHRPGETRSGRDTAPTRSLRVCAAPDFKPSVKPPFRGVVVVA